MEGIRIVWFLSVLCLASAIEDKYIEVESYTGYGVVRAVPDCVAKVEFLAQLPDHQLDFWTDPGLNRNVDIMAPPDAFNELINHLEEADIKHHILIPDVQRLVAEEKKSMLQQDSSNFSLYVYNEYPEIMDHLTNIAETVPEAQTEIIGQSWEGRDLMILKLCRGGCGNKPAIWIDGGIHAREWISPATVLWTISEVLNDPVMLDGLDWYFLPVFNPDGYQFTHEHTRLWRKTRSYHNSLLGCHGTDANRNFGHHWNTGGSSADKCFDTYHGPSAFSEPETAAVRDFLLARNGSVKYYNNMHSYSQLVLLSWGYTTDPPPNYMQGFSVADRGVTALTAVNGTQYTVGCIPCVLYVASGGASDWALGVAEIPYSYSMELRDTGRHGFLLPPSFIPVVGLETWQFHRTVAFAVLEEFRV